LRKAVAPRFPPLAKQAKITGPVWVEFRVDEAGHPQDLKPLGHPLLIESAVDAIEKSVFEMPGNDRYAVTIDFELIGDSFDPGNPVFEIEHPAYWKVAARPPQPNVEAAQINGCLQAHRALSAPLMRTNCEE